MSTVIAAAFGREVNILKGDADELTDASYELVTTYNGRRGALMWPDVISCKYIYKVDDCIHLRGSLLFVSQFKNALSLNNYHSSINIGCV